VSDHDQQSEEGRGTQDREPEWKRKQRLAEIFGDVLPAVTSDEREDAPPKKDESATDQWLKSQVPPHHG
jgi:hypothetical protein